MKEYSKTVSSVLRELNSSPNGLSASQVSISRRKYGVNEISKKKTKSILKRIAEALLEPMLIILEASAIITLGVNIGKALKGGNGDFYECAGILFAILISVVLTVVMEGKSQKAFETLNSVYDNALVKVRRQGEIILISQKELVVGDIVILESGDKITTDGRILTSNNLTVDESTLTGESLAVLKDENIVLNEKTPLAERKNMLYSGTFVTGGSGEMVVTAVGDHAEIGVIAGELNLKTVVSEPLQEKLDRLGKLIALLGLIASGFVLMLSITKLFITNNVSFDTIEEAFLNSIILIVASVPEGLPTTVAIALTLNVVKLYRSNALIKKLVAAETVGCVSVICSDKTGTLTENKMKVNKIVYGNNSWAKRNLNYNIAINSTAEIGKAEFGTATEIALLNHLKENKVYNYVALRQSAKIISRIPFDSKNKFMTTTISLDGKIVTYFKGAPEVLLEKSNLTSKEKFKILKEIGEYQKEGKRAIAFLTEIDKKFIFDGYALISDGVRKEVYSSVLECKKAGIKVKILTGDNSLTAYSIAKELKIANSFEEVVNAYDIDEISDYDLKKMLEKITVVARSTPKNKLRIVKLLKEMGEVVAVTGDGVNDAPAIKHADIGIAMGAGSEVSKEASDIVLLDNSFATIVKAISFGRNIYQNFQRFITFQLSVNVTAVIFIIISLILGLENPFNTVMLLWINIIMDGPPALTLGLEGCNEKVMENSPVKRSDNILTKKMLVKIGVHAGLMCLVLVMQNVYNFIGCGIGQMKTVLFNLFILFQLFNAFNSRELGSRSVFKDLKGNKLMLIVFSVTFILQIFLSECLRGFFGTATLPLSVWVKTVITASSIVTLSEIYKLIYRSLSKRIKRNKNLKKLLIKS